MNRLADVFGDAVLHMLYLLYHRGVRDAVGIFAADRDRAHALAVECADRGDEPASAGRDTCELQGHLYRFRAAICEEALLQIAGGDVSHGFCKISA